MTVVFWWYSLHIFFGDICPAQPASSANHWIQWPWHWATKGLGNSTNCTDLSHLKGPISREQRRECSCCFFDTGPCLSSRRNNSLHSSPNQNPLRIQPLWNFLRGPQRWSDYSGMCLLPNTCCMLPPQASLSFQCKLNNGSKETFCTTHCFFLTAHSFHLWNSFVFF